MDDKFITEDREDLFLENNKMWSSDLLFKEERENIINYIKQSLNE